jgi:heme/copper-type cytochrome/quinol oxidase subunit 2
MLTDTRAGSAHDDARQPGSARQIHHLIIIIIIIITIIIIMMMIIIIIKIKIKIIITILISTLFQYGDHLIASR